MLAKSQYWPNVGTTLFFNHTLPPPLGGYYNVGTTLARPFQIWRYGNLKTNKVFGDTEIWRHGNFNICTTIPDLGTTHLLPWIECEKNLDVVQGCIKNRTQTPTHQQKIVFCKFFKFCKNFVKNILLGFLGGFLHA